MNRKVYMVTEYGGEYEDAWQTVMGIFDSVESANKAIEDEYGDKLIYNEKTGEKHVVDGYWNDTTYFEVEEFEFGKYKSYE